MDAITRRHFLGMLSAIPFLVPIALELQAEPESADVHFLKSGDYMLGVGDSTIPASRNDTGLRGTNQAFTQAKLVRCREKPGDYGLTLEGEFESEEANFSWSEIALYYNGRFIRRKLFNGGIKCINQIWNIQYNLDIDMPLQKIFGSAKGEKW